MNLLWKDLGLSRPFPGGRLSPLPELSPQQVGEGNVSEVVVIQKTFPPETTKHDETIMFVRVFSMEMQ